MDIELKIKNFGPIDEAAIQVGQFTVFAGPNNTGKTFVAKMLYSILSARNANHTLVFFDAMARLIETELQLFERAGQVIEERPFSAIRRALQKIDSILRDVPSSYPSQNEIDRLKAVHPELMAEIEGIREYSQSIKKNVETKEESS
ncbi:MAG: AAA family ATPase, partial [Gemmatimonadetes bacterium]|nr:AAA family ATPase [Gemmatimonadota bacterium]